MKKFLSMALALLMVLSVAPMSAFAAVDYDKSTNSCDCYNVISKTDYEIAPGITESEIVLNFDDNSRRQVLHIMEADMSNEYVTVLNSYYGMIPQEGDFAVAGMTEQAAWVEENMGLNVVGGMNTTLSWYNTAFYSEHPELINSPLGFTMLNGDVVWDTTYGFPSVLVINKDFDENGTPRPADIPKVEMVTVTSRDHLDGWEYQIIPCSSGFIVKDGKNSHSENHLADNENSAPRSVVGIKPDGTIVTMMNDGRQSPYSAGMSMYECAEVMISLGCSYAVNCDGGGTSTFISQRPGEDLKINCSPSDGAERPTTSGILFISTAPADGAFARANITTENQYYTPGSEVKFDVLGTDLVGTAAEIPADAIWQIKEDGMGTISDGVFVSNGTTGTVTAQMVYEGKVVGEHAIEIVIPEAFSFSQNVMTIPFGKEVEIGVTATIHEGVHSVALNDNDVTFSLDNAALGTINGFTFSAVAQENAPEDVTGTLTATLNCNTSLVATASVTLGKGSETLFDFENGIDGWLVGEVNGNEQGHVYEISKATVDDGQVHDGNSSLKFYTDALKANSVDAGGYAQVGLYLEQSVIIENAKSLGFWAYIPDDFPHLFMRMFYWYDKDGNGTYESKNTITLVNQPTIYDVAEGDGWYYFSADVSAYSSIMITGLDQSPAVAGKPVAQNYRFIEIASPHTNTSILWQTYGSINGPRTVYIDSITVDYSDAVEDREAPIFGDVNLVSGIEGSVNLAKRNTVTTTNNKLSVTASVAENTVKSNATGLNAASAKAYIDGVLVESSFANGKISISDISVADGVHRVKFEIYDNAGNKSCVTRLVNVQSGEVSSAIVVEPKDPSLDRLYGGSLYWMNIKATNIENIRSIKTVIDINSVNHWELDHIELAPGFAAEYTVDKDTNSATITITRVGDNNQTGEAVLASLPVRIVYYDTDLLTEGHTAETYWNSFNFWPQDLKVDVDMGMITYVDGYTSDVLNTFSNDEFSVDTEMYTDSQHMDITYKAERGTCHVHTAEAIADLLATCTEAGYTGRTYCAVCDSVVDWGTIVPATGHNYTLVNGKLVCDCGDEIVATGLYNDGGAYRYLINGVAQSGWHLIDNEWHYFYPDTLAAKAGSLSTIPGVTYEIEETGKLKSGVWAKTLYGTRYYYGPTCYQNTWAEIDGNRYRFTNSYRLEGYRMFYHTVDGCVWYNFGDDGICRDEIVPDGFYYNGNLGYSYCKDGKSLIGLNKIDGEYYYFNYMGYAQTGKVNVGTTNCELSTGIYYFGEDYKALNGIIAGAYYVNGKPKAAGLIEIDGALYFAGGANGEISVNEKQYVWNGNGILPEGNYYFGADGKMLNGVAEFDGVKKYFVNGQPKMAGLIEFNGDLYFATGDGEIVTGTYYVWQGNGILPEGTYEFGTDGKLLNGVAESNGSYYYYINGRPKMAGLVEFNGDLYFATGDGEIVTGVYYVWQGNGILPEGTYEFGADGKMLNGIVERDGNYYYYVDGKPKMAGLIEIDGSYYFAKGGDGLCATGTYYVWQGNGILPEGTYEFGADGKMLNGFVTKDDGIYYYVNGKLGKVGLTYIDGYYYFVNSDGKLITSCTYYVWEPNGYTICINYTFDDLGRIILD